MAIHVYLSTFMKFPHFASLYAGSWGLGWWFTSCSSVGKYTLWRGSFDCDLKGEGVLVSKVAVGDYDTCAQAKEAYRLDRESYVALGWASSPALTSPWVERKRVFSNQTIAS